MVFRQLYIVYIYLKSLFKGTDPENISYLQDQFGKESSYSAYLQNRTYLIYDQLYTMKCTQLCKKHGLQIITILQIYD